VAVLRNGRVLFLECTPPGGTAAKAYLAKHLAKPDTWSVYADKGTVAIPISAVKVEVQRTILLTVFAGDFVDEAGWHHRVLYADGGQGQETLWALCEWLTGKGTNADSVARTNGLQQTTLRRGQTILIPAKLLLEAMRQPTPERMPLDEPDPWADLDIAAQGLTYVTEKGRTYAVYRLKQGEALYTAVVVRFTDLRDNASILKACRLVQEVSGIKDVHAMEPGTPVRIPTELLSDRFKPRSSPERQEYEEVLQEARRLKDKRVRSKDLEGVVVVLDPGHGGDAQGAEQVRLGLYEDEINYDIVMRIKRILEAQTRARVYCTLRDKSQGFKETNATRFRNDEDEVLLTTPNYDNGRAKTSVNLRWYLANSIYNKEVKAGTDPMKIIFTSVHCDALYDGRMRGAMVYIPGARLRRDREGGYSDPVYARFREVKEQPYFTATRAELRRDEAVSRNFAEILLEELGKKRIKRHKAGDPIRSQIRQNGGIEYVPAVLRNNEIPTKILVECANLTNSTDCSRVADPDWREWFAEAYVNALKRHFGD
jgi:N-acetylmuramoyl-L-alanine amidase